MKIGIIADIHGNITALLEVLNAIEKENPDFIICAGDMINPFYESREVWQLLKEKEIICLRGNHEDYMLDYFAKKQYLNEYNMKPVKIIAETFSEKEKNEIAMLPLTHTFQCKNDKLLICHASPENNKASFMNPICVQMEQQLIMEEAQTIVNAHLHKTNRKVWKNKKLYSVGSVGLPMNKTRKTEFAIVEYRKDNWCFHPKEIAYDFDTSFHKILESGFIQKAGSLSWLLLEELRSADMCFAHFIPSIKRQNPSIKTEQEWTEAVISFLKKRGCWEEIKQLI